MKCPNCETETCKLGSHATGTGDVYTYIFCAKCNKKFEIIKDELYGGEPKIKEV